MKGLLMTPDKWNISTTSLYKIPEIINHKREIEDMMESSTNVQKKRASRNIVGLKRNNGKNTINLPEFSLEMSEAVQLKWLNIYEMLLIEDNNEKQSKYKKNSD